MTIWYDYTTTLRNTGRSGIANVEWSVGKALRADRSDVRTFALVHRRGLVTIDADRALADAVYAQPQRDVANAVVTTGVGGTRAVVIEVLETFAPWAIRPIVAALRVPRRLRSCIPASNGRGVHDPSLRPEVQPGDVVVSMGADWGGELADELGTLRAATGCRVVTMVYDLIPLTHPHLAFHNDPAFFAEYYLRLLRNSDAITCISEQSRRDLLDFARARMVTPPPIHVLRLGEDEPSTGTGWHERDDFFLWVGTVERRKNLELLYDALRILESEGAELPRIVVAGAHGWGVGDLIAELGCGSTAASRAIVLLGSVDEEMLDGLYRRARALLFPSQYEGWGLPVREAAIRGCPVVAGDSPAVREATADLSSVVLLPVDDPGPWADALREPPVSSESAARSSWSATASELGSLVDRLAADEVTSSDR